MRRWVVACEKMTINKLTGLSLLALAGVKGDGFFATWRHSVKCTALNLAVGLCAAKVGEKHQSFRYQLFSETPAQLGLSAIKAHLSTYDDFVT